MARQIKNRKLMTASKTTANRQNLGPLAWYQSQNDFNTLRSKPNDRFESET